MTAHFILRFVDVPEDFGHRSVIANRACQHIRHTVLVAGIDDAVVNALGTNKLLNAAVIPHTVQGVQMIVMSVGHTVLGVNILPQCRFQIGSLQIVGSQCVARQNGIHIAVLNERTHGISGIIVKGEGWAHDPDDFSVLPLMAQHFIQFIIVTGEGSLAGTIPAESKGIAVAPGQVLTESVGVHINPLFPVLRAPHRDQVTLFQIAEFQNLDFPVFQYRHTVHAAFLRQQPLSLYLEVFGKNTHGMILFGRNPVTGRRHKHRIGCLFKSRLCKIGGMIGFQGKHPKFLHKIFPHYTPISHRKKDAFPLKTSFIVIFPSR